MTASSLMPSMFIGHGNPMNAISENQYRDTWLQLGASLPKPQAVLCISAHWQTHGTQIFSVKQPQTIHDFGGFPQELFDQHYPAPGAPELAMRICQEFAYGKITPSTEWGLDHGAWTILQSLFPLADVPVLQLSLNLDLDFRAHFDLAKQLTPLREQGIMLLGSGNIVHNLRILNLNGEKADWAIAFDTYIKNALLAADDAALLNIEQAGDAARLAVPTPEHYLPLLYIAAARQADDNMQFLTESFDLGTLSMRSVIYR